MKTIILTLEEAVKTELKGAELLKPEDKIIFVYQKGTDSISIAVHNILSALQCQIEFAEVPVIAVITPSNKNESTMLAYIAYLIGANENSIYVDSNNSFVELTYLDFHRTVNIRSAINITDIKDRNSILSGEKKEKPRKKRKEKVAVSEASSKEVVPDKEKITTESIMESKTEADKPKTRRTRNKQASSSAISSIEDLKVYLKTLSTDEFDPSTMTMGIFESVRNSIKNESDLEAEMEKTIIISKKIEMINNAVKENWPCIISGVQNIMSFASK